MNAELIWIVVGFALIIAELFLTSFIVVFFGIAAVLVGIALWAGLPADGGVPYILFAAIALGTLFGLRTHFHKWFTGRVSSAGVDEDFVGHEAKIESGFDASSPGRGRVQYRGASWDARSQTPEIAVGSYALIVDRDSMVLIVEPPTP